jgi:hypothetical protein
MVPPLSRRRFLGLAAGALGSGAIGAGAYGTVVAGSVAAGLRCRRGPICVWR